jgi:lipopolysaccharide transport system permease protein
MIRMDNNPSKMKKWDLLIRPKKNWFEIDLKGIWHYRDLLMLFVRRDIVATYKQTILGPFWFFISPIITVITFTFVFHSIAKISTDSIPAPLFYLTGTTMWNYFQNCLTGTSSTFLTNASIFGKVYFPRIISPLSLIISNLVKLLIQLVILLFFWIYYLSEGLISPTFEIIYFPILVLSMAILSLGAGIIISSLTTKYRDLSYFISFGVSLLMYATPVIYPVSAIPDNYLTLFELNPVAPIIEAFRYGLTGSGTFSFSGILYSLLFGMVTLFIGILLFNRVERNFMDTV